MHYISPWDPNLKPTSFGLAVPTLSHNESDPLIKLKCLNLPLTLTLSTRGATSNFIGFPTTSPISSPNRTPIQRLLLLPVPLPWTIHPDGAKAVQVGDYKCP